MLWHLFLTSFWSSNNHVLHHSKSKTVMIVVAIGAWIFDENSKKLGLRNLKSKSESVCETIFIFSSTFLSIEHFHFLFRLRRKLHTDFLESRAVDSNFTMSMLAIVASTWIDWFTTASVNPHRLSQWLITGISIICNFLVWRRSFLQVKAMTSSHVTGVLDLTFLEIKEESGSEWTVNLLLLFGIIRSSFRTYW